ncbi:MAG: nucleotidyltransferase family protein [Bacteroidota bacterium]|nr:nucleotidyltransferase family protein [Bacteroidota bacterium]
MAIIKEAIILAGGLGTRLRSAVPDLPKCMAPVKGKPFISYVIDHLQQQGIEQFILSLGYMSEAIIKFIQQEYPGQSFIFSVEEEPLGTGGAIRLACDHCSEKNVLVTNGDTMFSVNVDAVALAHVQQNADCTLALKPMQQFDRYGVVETNATQRIVSFKEKQYYENGLINGGLYILNREQFCKENFPEKFSFEKDYLETFITQRKMIGVVQDAYFIDIGIPEDYQRAQVEL